jgi:hypothetical protein
LCSCEKESPRFSEERREGGVVRQCLEAEVEEMRAVRDLRNKIKKERGERKNK